MNKKNQKAIQKIDAFDHGYRHLLNKSDKPVEEFTCHSDFIKRIFHKHKKNGKKIFILHSIARMQFYRKGYFHIDEYMSALEIYGYKKTRELKRRTLQELRSAPTFFKETKTFFFTFKSQKKLIGYNTKKQECLTIPANYLQKKNHKLLTDILIIIQKAGQIAPAQTIGGQMGLSRSRVFAAKKTGRDLGFKDCRVETPLPSVYTSLESAKRERGRMLFQQKLLTTIRVIDGQYRLMLTVGIANDFLQDRESDGVYPKGLKTKTKNKKLVPSVVSRKAVRTTSVFRAVYGAYRTALNPLTDKIERFVFAQFVSDEAGALFMSRHLKCAI